jgi:subtilisin family serine protease
VNSAHLDLVGKLVGSGDFTFSSAGANDRCDHGSRVAGIAAASTNNGVGIAGVGFNATLLNGKVVDDACNGSLGSLIQGLVWAVRNGASVVNMSLGGKAPGPCEWPLTQATAFAWNRGLVLIGAAGNNGELQARWPANCPHVLAVAGSTQAGALAPDSNHGQDVAVAAPGMGILSTNKSGGYTGNSFLDNFSGTSAAAPHVAGVAALLWTSPYGAPSAGAQPTNQAVVDRIAATAQPMPGVSAGRVDAQAAVSPPTIVTSGLPSGAVGQQYSVTLNAEFGREPYTWSVSGALPGGLSIDSQSGLISGTPNAAGSFSFTVAVRDVMNQVGTATFSIDVTGGAECTFQGFSTSRIGSISWRNYRFRCTLGSETYTVMSEYYHPISCSFGNERDSCTLISDFNVVGVGSLPTTYSMSPDRVVPACISLGPCNIFRGFVAVTASASFLGQPLVVDYPRF